MSPLGCAKPSGTLRLREFRPFVYGTFDAAVAVVGYWRWLWYIISHLSMNKMIFMSCENDGWMNLAKKQQQTLKSSSRDNWLYSNDSDNCHDWSVHSSSQVFEKQMISFSVNVHAEAKHYYYCYYYDNFDENLPLYHWQIDDYTEADNVGGDGDVVFQLWMMDSKHLAIEDYYSEMMSQHRYQHSLLMFHYIVTELICAEIIFNVSNFVFFEAEI